jgi:hypothetical protein
LQRSGQWQRKHGCRHVRIIPGAEKEGQQKPRCAWD